MSGGFFRGTSADQDTRFSNKQDKLMKSQKFAPELENLVDMTKVKLDVLKPWIAKRVTELIGFEDEVLINFIYGHLEGKAVNGKKVQIQITGFMERNTGKFMKELWTLLMSAQQNASGVPQEFLDAKEEETKKKKAETDRVANEIRMKREKHDLDEMNTKMDGNGETQGEKHARKPPTDEKERHKRNGSRGRIRVSHSSDSASRSPSPRRKRSESPNKSPNLSNERRRSRSISGAPKSRSRSVSSERRRRSSPGRSVTPRRRHNIRRSPSPLRHRSLRHRSPSPKRYRARPSWRYRSRSPLRRRSRTPIHRSPVRRRSRSPVRRRSRSPIRRRSRSPIRRRSRTPIRRRSPSPIRGRSPSPVRRRSPTPVKRQSPSPVVGRSLSPDGSASSRSTSPVRQLSPKPVRRSSPAPYGRRLPPHRRRSPVPERRRRSPSTSPKLSTSPPPRRSSLRGRDRSLTPRRSPSDRSSGSPSPTRLHSLRGSPRRIARSPLQSPGRRVRSREEYSPARRASPIDRTELPSKSRTVLKSVDSKPVVVIRSPQREDLNSKNSRRKDRHSSPSIGDRRSTSPHGSPYTKRVIKSHPESLSSLTKSVESKPRRDETGIRVDAKNNSSRREIGDPKHSSSGNVSPTSVRRKDAIDSAEVNDVAEAPKSRATELTRSDKPPNRLGRKEHSERQLLSTIQEEADASKKGREQSHKVTEKNGAMDSMPIKIEDPAVKGKEKRKHGKSGDYSSDDSHEERKEAKKRKKEEKKLKKEERRRRREERRRKKEEKRKLKSVDSGSSSSDPERNHSEDDSVRRRDLQSNTQDTESQQKKLEIELREKALESLRAKRGIGN